MTGPVRQGGRPRLGFQPFPLPAANTSRAYTNPLGVQPWALHLSAASASASAAPTTPRPAPQTTHPAGADARTRTSRRAPSATSCACDLDARRQDAPPGVTYIDAQGKECEQPADLVSSAPSAQHNVRLLLLLGHRQALRPDHGQGRGRRATTPTRSTRRSTASSTTRSFNPFMAARARSAWRSTSSTATTSTTGPRLRRRRLHRREHRPRRPITAADPVPAGHAALGQRLEEGDARTTTTTSTIVAAARAASCRYRDNYLDLDPTYKDASAARCCA